MLSMLIVDDEDIIREGIRDYVDWAAMGISICGEASSGQVALEQIQKLKPHILLTDVVMPGMDGIELIKAIREQQLPVEIVVLSAFENFQYIKSALKFDAIDYLLKPFNETELQQVMNKVVAQVKRGQKIQQYVPEQLLNDNALLPYSIAQEVIRIMEQQYADNKLTLQLIADAIPVSINHMSAVFKRETGETVTDFLTKVRMMHAKRLLLNPMYKVYEIASLVGYTDANYFAKVFKKSTGLSPKEFKERRL